MKSDKIEGYILEVREFYRTAKKNFSMDEYKMCAGALRSALEAAVKIVWLKKYDKEPVWVFCNKEGFNLFEAIKDQRFDSLFDDIAISDMHVIRVIGNKELHPELDRKASTVAFVKKLINRFEECVETIQDVIGVDIMEKPSTSTQTVFVDTTEYKHVSQKTSISVISVNKESHSETVEKNYEQGDKIMRSGEIVRVRTNAELLNELFGLNYKAWMKSVYDFDDKRVWMIHLDNQERNGWKNYKINNTIIEENLCPDDLTGLRVDVRPNNLRIVFSKHNNHFVFEGVYMYDKERSEASKSRYWQKVAEEF